MARCRHTRASEETKLLQTLALATNSPRLQADLSVISSTSEHRPARFLQRHPVVAAPGHRPPMGNHGTECYLSKCPEGSAGHRAQRDDGDRHALPSRHRRSQAATAPAIVAAWQSAWAHLPKMASVCCAQDASTLQRTARATSPNARELRNSTFAITIDATNKPVSRNSKTPIYQLKYCINRSTVIK